MHADAHPAAPSAPRCPYDWCATPHGHTLHPDDEDHRSDGLLVEAVVRDDKPERRSELEIGVLRRRGDAQPWLVVEDGSGTHLELRLCDARAIIHAVQTTPTLRTALTND